MEIYKLSDEIPDNKLDRLTKKHKHGIMRIDASEDAGVLGGELKISDIRQAVKNENRVNVYVNDKYAFSLDIAQVVELGVKAGHLKKRIPACFSVAKPGLMGYNGILLEC